MTNSRGQAQRAGDFPPYLVSSGSARAAILAFVTNEHASLLGAISELPGDKAVVTAAIEERIYVLFVERAVEAIRDRDSARGADAIRP